MANKLLAIQAQIEQLQRQAQSIRSKDREKALMQVVEQMNIYGITIAELQRAMSGGKRVAGKRGASTTKVVGKPKRPTAKVEAKYRGPNGETWTGRGIAPRWLAALVAAGHNREEFLIAPPPAANPQ